LPAGCAEFTRKALAKAPVERFQTATEMQAALEAILAAEPTVEVASDATRTTDATPDLTPSSFPPGTLAGGSTVANTPLPRQPSRRGVLLAAVPLVAATSGIGAYFALRKPNDTNPTNPDAQPNPAPAPVAKEKHKSVETGGPVGAVDVSPDGRWLA